MKAHQREHKSPAAVAAGRLGGAKGGAQRGRQNSRPDNALWLPGRPLRRDGAVSFIGTILSQTPMNCSVSMLNFGYKPSFKDRFV